MSENQNIVCPHCDSRDFVRNGKYKNKQRFLCKHCGSTFNKTTNTAVHHIRNMKEWKSFVKMMIESEQPLSLNELSKRLKISSKTAHNWKHKFLSSLIELDTLKYEGQLEVNLVYIPFWTKGKHDTRKTIKMREKEILHKQSSMYASFLCVVSKDDFDFFPVQIHKEAIVEKEHLNKCLDQLNIPRSCSIVTRMDKDIQAYYESHDFDSSVAPELCKSEEILKSFNTWTKNFKGFSTKYIWNYLKWFKIKNLYSKGYDIESLVSMSLKDSRGWLRFMMINHFYREFIISK